MEGRSSVLFAGLRFSLHDSCMTTDTPIFNAVLAITPYPVLKVDTKFSWKAPSRAPKVGVKPVVTRKRKK